MINRYTQITPYSGDFYTPPLDLLKSTLQEAQSQYNDNYALASQIKNKYVNALQQDRASANTIQKGWEDSINNIVSKYSGDYSQATKDMNNLLSEMQRDYNPGGKAHAIESNYKSWTEHWKGVQEGLQKGTYTSSQAQASQNNFLQNYKGVGEKDPLTGSYAQMNPEPLNKYVDEYALMMDVIPKVPKRKQSIAVPVDGGNGKIFMTQKEVEYVDPREMETAVTQTLLNNDGWVSYMSQLARLQGQDPNQIISDTINTVGQNIIPAYSGVMSDKQDVKLQYDQAYIARLNHSLSLQRQRENNNAAMKRVLAKHLLDNPQEPTESKQDLVRIATRTGMNTYSKIDKDMGANMTDAKSAPWKSLLAAPLVGPASLLGSAVQGMGITGDRGPTSSKDVDYIIDNPSKFSNINSDLLKSAKEAAIRRGARDVNGVAIDIYNDFLDRDHYGDAIYMRRFSNSDAMKEQASRLLPNILGGTVDIWEMDANTGLVTDLKDNSKARLTAAAELWDKSAQKPMVPALGMTSVQTGVPFGTVFPKADGGYYIVGEMHEDIRNMNNGAFKNAFGFINSPSNTGGQFTLEIDGKPTQLYGRKEYGVNAQGYISPEVRYYDTNNELFDKGTRPDGSKIPVTPAEMEDYLLTPEYRKLFTPFKASSSDKTRFSDYLEQED